MEMMKFCNFAFWPKNMSYFYCCLTQISLIDNIFKKLLWARKI